MSMNPEFRRNLWLEITPTRLAGMPLVLLAAIFMAWLADEHRFGGGRFRPHKTHQNGLSVDFFVPVIDETGKSVPLPTSPLNKFGYGIEFTSEGKYQNYRIDFDAMAAHLLALKKAADQRGVKIWRVILDNDLQKLLFQTSKGKELQTRLTFSKKKPWIRHDEHYHIDFIVPCGSSANHRVVR